MPIRLGPWEITLIVIIVLFIFGAGRLPQVGDAIGKTVKAFRKSITQNEEHN